MARRSRHRLPHHLSSCLLRRLRQSLSRLACLLGCLPRPLGLRRLRRLLKGFGQRLCSSRSLLRRAALLSSLGRLLRQTGRRLLQGLRRLLDGLRRLSVGLGRRRHLTRLCLLRGLGGFLTALLSLILGISQGVPLRRWHGGHRFRQLRSLLSLHLLHLLQGLSKAA